jgi:hypothetical protein
LLCNLLIDHLAQQNTGGRREPGPGFAQRSRDCFCDSSDEVPRNFRTIKLFETLAIPLRREPRIATRSSAAPCASLFLRALFHDTSFGGQM